MRMRCLIQQAANAAMWVIMLVMACPMLVSSAAGAPSTAYVSFNSSTSLMSALRNESVSTIVLTSDYNLGELVPEVHATLKLDRNVTITGLPGHMPVLDLGFKPEVLSLCSSCQLTFVDLAIANDRRGTGQAFEGISSEGPSSVVLLINVVRLRVACTPATDSGDVINETRRSTVVPASSSRQQEFAVQDVTFEGRAYANSLVVHDVSIDYPLVHQEGRVHSQKDKGHFGGYTMWERNVTRLCAHITSEQCLEDKPAESCVSDLIDQVQAAAATRNGVPTPMSIGLIVVVVVLPVLFVGLLVLGVFLIVRRWRQRQQQQQPVASSKHGNDVSREHGDDDVEKQQATSDTAGTNPPPSHLCHADSATESMLQRKVSVHVQLLQNESRPPLGGNMQGWDVASISTSPFVGPVEDVHVEFGELLGSGSFGRVYKARWCGKDVAVKVIEHDVNTLVAVEAEAELALSLNHPNLVRAYHYVTYTQDAQVTTSVSSSQGSHLLRQPSGWTDAQSTTVATMTSDSAMDNNTGSGLVVGGSNFCQTAGSGTSNQLLGAGCNVAIPSRGSNHCSDRVAVQAGSAASSDRPSATVTTGSILERTNSSWTTCKPVKAETWLVLEYCDRGTLGSVAEAWSQHDEGDQQMLQRLLLLQDVARGLVALHKDCVVHADLNARNVLVSSCDESQNGTIAKLADLGLSRVIRERTTHRTTNTVGTISHQPPELLRYGRMSPAVDLYSMGIMMWEIYTGQVAFPKLHYGQFFETVVLQNLRPLVPDNMPQDYAMLMRQCWAAEPTDRPNAQQLLATLDIMVKNRQHQQERQHHQQQQQQQQKHREEGQQLHGPQCSHNQTQASSSMGGDAAWEGLMHHDEPLQVPEPLQGPLPSATRGAKTVRWQQASVAHEFQGAHVGSSVQNFNTSWFV